MALADHPDPGAEQTDEDDEGEDDHRQHRVDETEL
jgi:hypothetical protein